MPILNRVNKNALQNHNLLKILILLLQQIILHVSEKSFRKIDDKIRDEKLQYDINREAEKTSALLYG